MDETVEKRTPLKFVTVVDTLSDKRIK